MEYVSSIRSIYGVLAQAVAHLENWEAAVCCMYIYSYVCVCVYICMHCAGPHTAPHYHALPFKQCSSHLKVLCTNMEAHWCTGTHMRACTCNLHTPDCAPDFLAMSQQQTQEQTSSILFQPWRTPIHEPHTSG